MGTDPNKEDDLRKLISIGREQGQEITAKVRERMKDGQYIVDLADEVLEVTKYGVPPNINLDPMLRAWEYVSIQQGEILKSLNGMPVPTSGTAVAYSVTELSNPGYMVPFVPPDKQSEVTFHVQRLSQVIDRHTNRNEVLTLLNHLNLNVKVKDVKSPGELFEIAWGAFESPVTAGSPATTSLIPMRECIERVLTILLQRRPRQEPTRNLVRKLLSILNQLALDSVPTIAKEDLANRWAGLNDELSASKQKDLGREEWRDALRRATLFLLELLQSIDKSKLKSI